ncbi:HNH endonuclease [Gordonia phage Gudmit]|nr:HNH endonuclease [Gordonia phage Gudmit]
MPSPWQTKVCEHCGATWRTRKPTARTCSPTCRARLREIEHGPTRGAEPREYPAELVDKVQAMYAAGHTITEIQAEVHGAKVQNIIRRYDINTRPAIKRDQRGEKNHMWRGDAANYQALHLRVESARGKPSRCARCWTTTPGRYEWANRTGKYEDINDYVRLCVSCHRRYDAARRQATGRRTSPERR